VLENALAGLALVIGAVGALADLLEDDVADLLETGGVHTALVSAEAPGVDDDLGEVGLTFSGEHDVHKRVVDAELLLSDTVGTLSAGVNASAESSEDIISFLLTGENAGVLVSTVVGLELSSGEAISASSDLSPCAFDNGKAGIAHVSAHGLDEFIVGDASVLVVVKVVGEGAEFLGGKEDAKSSEHSLELELVEHFVHVLVEGHKDVAQLVNAVNALGIKLELELVDDLFKAVSPVGHLF